MRVVNTAEMKEMEKTALEEYGLEESLIIENIGIRGANRLHEQFLSKKSFGEIVLLIGKGNNGADGLAIGRHLREFGYRVRAFMLFDESESSKEVGRQAKMAFGMGVKINAVRSAGQIEAYFQENQGEYFVVDAIFGTGIRLPLSNFIHDVIKTTNRHASLCVALDIPTGITGDAGMSKGVAVRADFTLAVGVPKVGYYSANGARHSGEVIILSAGFPKHMIRKGSKNLIGLEFMSKVLGKRNKFAHKNSFGHTLVLGGSPGQVGAVVLAANGALKVGSGLVTVATWEDSYGELNMKLNPEIMSRVIPKDESKWGFLSGYLDNFDTLVVGPGLGQRKESKTLLRKVLMDFMGPVVLDADAIHCLSDEEGKRLLKGRKQPVIITPHLGEFAAFTQKTVSAVEAAPVDSLREIVDEVNSYVILKGPGTYIGFPTGEIFINYMPNAGMATGGSGDVLAGMIGGLLAQAVTKNQFFNPNYMSNEWDASVTLGVFVHSLAGFHAAERTGVRAMTAWSIINHIQYAFSDIGRSKQEIRPKG
ncbi:MAG: NAD(P)H-hydrate dehydratase [Bacteriovoracales bacterium]|nr:NAD(P)H-hydrate dehydratase [Bacteriovoracales bacterium]